MCVTVDAFSQSDKILKHTVVMIKTILKEKQITISFYFHDRFYVYHRKHHHKDVISLYPADEKYIYSVIKTLLVFLLKHLILLINLNLEFHIFPLY